MILLTLSASCKHDKIDIPDPDEDKPDVVEAKDTIAPEAMTNVDFNVGDGLVNISWKKSVSTDVYNYEIKWNLGAKSGRAIVKAADNTCNVTGLINFETYSFEIFAMDSAGNRSTSFYFRAMPVADDLNAPDLDICYIKRLPEIEYVENSTMPDIEGWPAINEEIIWRAFVKNWSKDTVHDVVCTWSLGGEIINTVIDKIPPYQIASTEITDNWTFTRKEIKLDIELSNPITEVSLENNSLTTYSDALSVHFYVEKKLYNYFHKYQSQLNIGSNSWEDWAQRHLTFINNLCENAIYDVSPSGILDRFRLDSIIIVPDGALPLNGGLPGNNPDVLDKKCDLQWGFSTELLHENDGMPNFYINTSSATIGNPFYIEGSLWHELGHARYLIDGYGFDLSDNGDNILIEEDGKRIAGTSFMPYKAWNVVHYHKYPGLMASPYEESSPYVAAAMNLIAGHRAVCGNMNAPCNIGVYIQDLPAENVLKVVEENTGNVCVNANVKFYQASALAGHWYGKKYDNIPDIEMNTDANGQLLMGHCPFSSDGTIVHTYGNANGLLILRIEYDGNIYYRFLESSEFNLEYWKGNTEIGQYTVYI